MTFWFFMTYFFGQNIWFVKLSFLNENRAVNIANLMFCSRDVSVVQLVYYFIKYYIVQIPLLHFKPCKKEKHTRRQIRQKSNETKSSKRFCCNKFSTHNNTIVNWKFLVYILDSKNIQVFRFAINVTTWIEYFVNIWPFTTMKSAQQSLTFFKVCSKY